PRQRGDAADEAADLVVAAGVADADRQLGVEVALDLAHRLKELLLEPGGEPGLRDVDEQARDLGLPGQLPQHRAERALDLGELLPISVEVRGLALARLERRAQILLLALRALEDRLLGLHDE